MVLPKRGQDLPHQLKIKTTARDMPTGQPDLGRPSLRLSSQVTLGCDKVTFKMNHHWEIHHAAEHLVPLDEHEGDRDARVHLLRHLGSSATASCSIRALEVATGTSPGWPILSTSCISFASHLQRPVGGAWPAILSCWLLTPYGVTRDQPSVCV